MVADVNLRGVVEAWPTLPAAVRAGIVAMVRASRPSVDERNDIKAIIVRGPA